MNINILLFSEDNTINTINIMKRFYILLIAFLSINAFLTSAQPHAGGHFEWTNVGQDSFLVSLILYRDCNAVNIGSMNITAKCATSGTTITTASISKPSPINIINITPTCEGESNRCQTFHSAFPYGFEKYIYTTLMDFSNAGSCCKIQLIFNTCCRNFYLNSNFVGSSIYIDAILDRCVSLNNNSLHMCNEPFTVLCLGQDAVINLGFHENNNSSNSIQDSLSYEWTTPLQGATSPITYTGQYAYNKPLYFWGFPNTSHVFPRGYHLDPQTGDILFRPMKSEITLVALKVKQWRNINGQMSNISEQTVDFQVIVLSCPSNYPPTLSGSFYKEVCVGDSVYFNITSNDYDMADTIRIFYDSSITGASWSSNNDSVKHPTAVFSWTPGPEDVSPYPHTFTVTVKDDACPLNGRATRAYQILVKANPKADFSVADSGCGNYHFHAQKTAGNNPAYSWNADFFLNKQATGDSVSAQIPGKGRFPYSLVVSENGCSSIYFDTVITSDSFLYSQNNNSIDVCYGDSLSLTASYFNNKGPVSFLWTTGDTTQHISYPIVQDQHFEALITDSFGCQTIYSIFVDMHDLPKVDMGADRYWCVKDTQEIYAQYQLFSPHLQSISWYDKTNSLVLADTINHITVSDSGFWRCRVEDSLGCVNEDSLSVFINPPVEAFAANIQICEGDTARLMADTTGSKNANVSYKWYEINQGKLVGQKQKTELLPLQTTQYQLHVSEEIGGTTCFDNHFLQVTVHENPKGSMQTLPNRCIDGKNITLNNYISKDSMVNALWSGKGIAAPSFDEFDPELAGAGTHTIHLLLVDSLTGCQADFSQNIEVFDLPVVFAGDDMDLCWGTDSLVKLSGIPALPPGDWTSVSGLALSGSPGNYYFNAMDTLLVPGQYYQLLYQYTDSHGCQNSDTLQLSVNQLIADFTSDLTYGTTPLSIYFSDLSDGQKLKLMEWKWDFGDGHTSTMSDPLHIFQDTGSYHISLWVSDGENCADSIVKANFIRVTSTIGMEEDGQSYMLIYPNPAKNELFIKLSHQPEEIVSIELHSMKGQIISSQQVNKQEIIHFENLNLPPAYYSLKFTYESGKTFFHKIMIKN
jgi:hypothetical protein